MTLECARVGGNNLAQGDCETEVLLPFRAGAQGDSLGLFTRPSIKP